jgi:hypothetical protein
MSQPRPLRIVWVCPYPVLPTTAGGKVRIVKLARQLTRLGVRVTVVTPYHPRQTTALIDQEPFSIVQVPYPFILPLLLTDRPFPYQYWTSLHPGLAWLMRRHFSNADIVQFEHPQFARLASQLSADQAVVYSSHNVEYDYARAECRSAWSSNVVGRRIAKLERSLIARSQHIMAVSNADCLRFSWLYAADPAAMTVAPNGIDLPGAPLLEDRRALERFPSLASYPKRGLYSGSNVMHNRIAVQMLLSEVAPKRPDIAFVIHGSCALPFQSGCKLGNVFFDSDMTHFRDYTSPGFIGLNTVTTGAGSNLKLLQYLCHGMPVISTRFGMRGFEDLLPYVAMGEPAQIRDLMDDAIRSPVPLQMLKAYEWSSIAAGMLGTYRNMLSAS